MRIFDIQRFSIHDGPGIRTTVFLKGCPLRCRWCQNPEGFRPEPDLFVEAGRCVQCGKCLQCQQAAIDTPPTIDRSKCTDCFFCTTLCKTGALTTIGRTMSVDSLMKEILEDRDYLINSGGGVTVSGGEPLLQAEEVALLLEKVKLAGLTTVVDTCGHVPWESIALVSPLTDLFLYDLKTSDPDHHEEWTGVDNELIIDNLTRLVGLRQGKGITIRIPLIPGVNDSEEELDMIAEIYHHLGLGNVEKLPLHSIGKQKWESLGLQWRM